MGRTATPTTRRPVVHLAINRSRLALANIDLRRAQEAAESDSEHVGPTLLPRRGDSPSVEVLAARVEALERTVAELEDQLGLAPGEDVDDEPGRLYRLPYADD